MTLISIHWRETDMPTVAPGVLAGIALLAFAMPASWFGAQLVWQWAGGPVPAPRAVSMLFTGVLSPVAIASLVAPAFIVIGLHAVRVLDHATAISVWAIGIPWCLPPLAWVLPREVLVGCG